MWVFCGNDIALNLDKAITLDIIVDTTFNHGAEEYCYCVTAFTERKTVCLKTFRHKVDAEKFFKFLCDSLQKDKKAVCI